MWAPAVIFWSHIIPEYSDIIKPTECDTSFRSNKLFKTLTALVNFYIPLLTIILISCRIMIAIRSRSKMEFGRRISSTRQKHKKQGRTFNNSSLISRDSQANLRKYSVYLKTNDKNEKTVPISITVNPFDSTVTTENIISYQFDENSDLSIETGHPIHDDNKNLCHLGSKKNNLIDKTRFPLSHLKSITKLFPSLSSLKKYNQRNSESLTRNYSLNHIVRTSSSVSTNMKYAERQSNVASNDVNHIQRALSTTSSLSGECSHTISINPMEEDILTTIEQMNG